MFNGPEILARQAHLQDWSKKIALQNELLIALHGGHHDKKEVARLKEKLKILTAEIEVAEKSGGDVPLVHLAIPAEVLPKFIETLNKLKPAPAVPVKAKACRKKKKK